MQMLTQTVFCFPIQFQLAEFYESFFGHYGQKGDCLELQRPNKLASKTLSEQRKYQRWEEQPWGVIH